MNRLKKGLQAINNELMSIVKKIENLFKLFEKLDFSAPDSKAKSGKKPDAKAKPAAKKAPATKKAPVAKSSPKAKTTSAKTAKKTAPKKPAAAKKAAAPKTKPAKAAQKDQTAQSADTLFVIDLIKKEKDGISVADLREKTKFDSKKISNIVHRAVKKGLVQRAGKGVYKSV